MKKTSISTNGSNNRLSYLDSYEEISRFKKTKGGRKHEKLTRENNPKEVVLSRKSRWVLFTLFFVVQILMNMDHGTIPAATENIRKDLGIDDDILGIFGSLVFFGNLIGSIISFTMINCFSRKYMLIFSLLLNAICLYSFTVTDILWILFVNRIIVGIFQAYVSIYLPVWCDQFGMKNKKTLMISLIQAGSPVGVVVGYFLTFFIKDTYKASIIAVMVVVIIFFPSIYFSSNLVSKNGVASPSVEINEDADNDKYSVFRDVTVSHQHDNANTSMDLTSVNNIYKKETLFKNLCIILKNKVFIFSAMGLSSLFFVITAVQYWASDYMEQALQVDDTKMVLISFSIVCVTSPTLGVIIGGWTISMIGGYESKHSILLCLIYGIFAGLFSIPVTNANGVTEFTIYLWLVLFFGGAIVPAITGIIISTVPNHLRGLANSFTSFLLNLFGYLPAPFVYGMINNAYKETNNRLAFFCVMNYSFVGVVFLTLACYFRYKYFNQINQKYSTQKSLLAEMKYSARNIPSHRGSLISDNLAKIFGTPYAMVNESDEESNDVEEESNNDAIKNSNNINNNETILTLDINTKKSSSDNNIGNNMASIQTPQFNLLFSSSEIGDSGRKGKNVEISHSFKKDKEENEFEDANNDDNKEEFYSSVCSEENNFENEYNVPGIIDQNIEAENSDKVAQEMDDQSSEKKMKATEN